MSEYVSLVEELRETAKWRNALWQDLSRNLENAADAIQALKEQNEELTRVNNIKADVIEANLNALAAKDQAIEEARNAALEEAAQVAAQACLVPPDGGSPTEDEYRVCEAAASYIRSLKGE